MALSAKGIVKDHGHRAVLSGVDVGIGAGDRIALIGANGTGKSTLLRILAGREVPDDGTIVRAGNDEMGFLPQHLPTIEGETIQDVITSSVAGLQALERRMRELEQAMSNRPEAAVLAEYAEVSERFETRGGYEIDARTDEVLGSLGAGYLGRDRLISGLSGGEKARVALAALLLAAPDVLLLDEPTNDLDDRALTWLEGYLKGYRGGVLFVTHDRDFIDAVATAILELDEHTHRLTRYEGNYGRYLDAKRAAHIRAQQMYDEQQDEIALLRKKLGTTAHAVGMGRAASDGDKHAHNFRGAGVERAVSRNVRSLREKLARIAAHRLQPPPDPLRFRADFAAGRLRPGTVAGRASHVAVRYGSHEVLADLSCVLDVDDRVCLIGTNGSGKSTLVRLMAGQTEPDHGSVWWPPEVRIGYLPQEPTLPLPAGTVGENLTVGLQRAGVPNVTDEARGWLARWGLLTRDDLTKRLAELSVGQRRKLELGILVGSNPDALLLDEPTNHLSFDVVEALQAALTTFKGPVLIVTHDRRLIRTFPRKLWMLDDARLEVRVLRSKAPATTT